MFYLCSKKSLICLRVAAVSLFSFLVISTQAQDAILTIKGQTSMKLRAKGLAIGSGIKSVSWTEEIVEGVNIEIKKNGNTIAKAVSEKKGKYSFQVSVNTADPKNDYVVYFSKEGMAPQIMFVNGYVPKEESPKYQSAKYEVSGADVRMISTTIQDIDPVKPFVKIKWDKMKEHKFTVDPVYEKVALGEELKILANPDQYYASLVKKKKKLDDALASKKAAADAKLKAEEEAKKKVEEEARLKAEAEAKALADKKAKADAAAKALADKKAKEETDRLAREQAAALLKIEMHRKHIADSLAQAAREKAARDAANASAKVDIKQTVTPVEIAEIISKDLYDASETFSINIARKTLNMQKERMNKEKAVNLAAKYETINTLTSLLDVVDEYDKNNKRQ